MSFLFFSFFNFFLRLCKGSLDPLFWVCIDLWLRGLTVSLKIIFSLTAFETVIFFKLHIFQTAKPNGQ